MNRKRNLIVGLATTASLILVLCYLYNIRNLSFQNFDAPSPAAEPITSTQQPFPKKIWQSWKDDSDDPTSRTIGFPRKWREVNSGWRYERITDANCDAYVASRFSPDVSAVFTSLRDPILRADLLRYLVLLLEGGVWADIDVLPHQPISSWVPDSYQNETNMVVGIENDKHKSPIWPGSPYSIQLAQYTILVKPNHPAMIRLVDRVINNLVRLFESKKQTDSVSFADVMSTTGPFAFTDVLMEYFTEVTGVEHTGNELDRLQEPKLIGDVLVLPKDGFGWLPQDHDHDRGHKSILVEHLFIGSWRSSHPG
ncbi:nucleotide-diphospho-sugar transferase [Nemania sp. FL0916]|nr:nucleotide-diphospho-sugar transferase [Nemania sp. FL0916]